jgi:hypothetical protein
MLLGGSRDPIVVLDNGERFPKNPGWSVLVFDDSVGKDGNYFYQAAQLEHR